MIFRWSIWGKDILKNSELLRYSILSFKKHFGNNHNYIVFTDNYNLVSRQFDNNICVKNFPHDKNLHFCIKSNATWQKWCPSPRLDITQDEFFIDADVFLLKYPKEVDKFLNNPKLKFGIMDEFFGQPYQHGAMQKKASTKTPYVIDFFSHS